MFDRGRTNFALQNLRPILSGQSIQTNIYQNFFCKSIKINPTSKSKRSVQKYIQLMDPAVWLLMSGKILLLLHQVNCKLLNGKLLCKGSAIFGTDDTVQQRYIWHHGTIAIYWCKNKVVTLVAPSIGSGANYICKEAPSIGGKVKQAVAALSIRRHVDCILYGL